MSYIIAITREHDFRLSSSAVWFSFSEPAFRYVQVRSIKIPVGISPSAPSLESKRAILTWKSPPALGERRHCALTHCRFCGRLYGVPSSYSWAPSCGARSQPEPPYRPPCLPCDETRFWTGTRPNRPSFHSKFVLICTSPYDQRVRFDEVNTSIRCYLYWHGFRRYVTTQLSGTFSTLETELRPFNFEECI